MISTRHRKTHLRWKQWYQRRVREFTLEKNMSSIDELQEFHVLVKNSEDFESSSNCEFPTTYNRITHIANGKEEMMRRIVSQAKDSRILVHERVKKLMENFLQHKKSSGTKLEKDCYQESNIDSWEDLAVRLIRKRPLAFLTASDYTLLRNGQILSDASEWYRVATDENCSVKISKYLTYDEIQISALLGTSVGTYFINSGSRNNGGVKDASDFYPLDGHYLGLVGARFEKPEFMESQYILVSPQRNTEVV
eukprot:TRINITY_DN9644_c0_g1_i4.p1 TRINITY_DN9644_c0_g1~~TRINITY_DN9644_c0_g1_i4.p1  ORF type:complete len:251 (-),score=52.28 TRINITY_DN9644_c0_g1_i4:1061-1813(-)